MKFQDISAPAPTPESLDDRYTAIIGEFTAATDLAEVVAAIDQWETIRREVETWNSLTHVRFHQDTRNEEYRKARDYADELQPKITDYDVQIKRMLLAHPKRTELETKYGKQAFLLWDAEVQTFAPEIADDMIAEAKLVSEYVELISSAELEFDGETHNISSIAKYSEHADREVRHGAARVMWQWFTANRDTLDGIYDRQVKLRHAMATKLGFNNFVELGYKRMCRVDYDQRDVERYRNQVLEHVVPFAVEYRRRQAELLAADPLMFWDENLHDPSGNPAPAGDHDWMLAQATAMFDEMGGGLGEFFRLMRDSDLLDLKIRPGKAGGGFCTAFPTVGLPFIYANFNGSKGDVEVFTHEAGHAFQCYESRNQPLYDYLWPTYESCEIHSMSLEFLTWPHMEKFFGDDAERFRKVHLAGSLLFLPYGVTVDHFQHLVYERPEATPAQRHAMWQELERLYMPWRDYGDLEHPAAGALWQQKQHIYCSPLYYIDYTLAQCCALQYWDWDRRDPAAAMESYVALCKRGGEASFQQLAAGAGLKSPLADDCLGQIVAQAREVLEV